MAAFVSVSILMMVLSSPDTSLMCATSGYPEGRCMQRGLSNLGKAGDVSKINEQWRGEQAVSMVKDIS